ESVEALRDALDRLVREQPPEFSEAEPEGLQIAGPKKRLRAIRAPRGCRDLLSHGVDDIRCRQTSADADDLLHCLATPRSTARMSFSTAWISASISSSGRGGVYL